MMMQIIKLSTGHTDFRAIIEETKNAELIEEKEKKNLLVTTRMMLLNLTISI